MDQQKMVYVSIAKSPNTILCEYTPYKGNYSSVASLVLPKVEKDGFETIKDIKYTIHIYKSGKVMVLCVTKAEVNPNEVYKFLEQIYGELKKRMATIDEIDNMVAYGLKILNNYLEDSLRDFNVQSSMAGIMTDLIETKDVMVTNLCNIMDRDLHINEIMETVDQWNKKVNEFKIGV